MFKQLKRIASLLTVMTLIMSYSPQAHARILFTNEVFETDAETLILDFDGESADSTLQFGNDGTDATIFFDDSTEELIFDTVDGDFIFEGGTLQVGSIVANGDTLVDADGDATTGTGTAAVTSQGNVMVAIGADTNDFLLNNGVADGTSLCTDSLTVPTAVRFDLNADCSDNAGTDGTYIIGSAAATVTVTSAWAFVDGDADGFLDDGEDLYIDSFNPLEYDLGDVVVGSIGLSDVGTGPTDSGASLIGIFDEFTNSNSTNLQDVLDDLDAAVSGAGSPEFEDIYANDIDDTLTTVAFDIDASGAVGIDSDAGLTFGGAGITATSDGNNVFQINSNGTSASSIDINALGTGGGIDFDTTDGGITFDAAGVTNGDITLTAGDDFTVASTGLADLDSGGAFSINSSGGAINIGNDAVAQGINIGTGAAARTIAIGNATGATAVNIDAGTGGWSIDAAGASNISTTGVTSDITFASGRDIIFDDDNLSGTVVLSVADADWDSDFAGDGIIDNINDITTQIGGDTISTFGFTEDNVLTDNDAVYSALDKLDLKWGDLASVANTEGASLVGVEDSAGYYSTANVEAVLAEIGAQIGTNADNNEQLIFYPEFPDAVLWEDGSNNRGRLDALYDDTNDEHYYNWSSRTAALQDISIKFRFTLPSDFVSLATANAFDFNVRTNDTATTNNNIEMYVFNVTDAMDACASDTTNISSVADTWEVLTIDDSVLNAGCTALDPGDVIEVEVKLFANNVGGAYTDIGYLQFNYDN